MKISKRVQPGEEIPSGYGIAYHDYYFPYAIAYPIPLNLIVRFLRWLWHETIRLRRTKFDEMLTEAYRKGLGARNNVVLIPLICGRCGERLEDIEVDRSYSGIEATTLYGHVCSREQMLHRLRADTVMQQMLRKVDDTLYASGEFVTYNVQKEVWEKIGGFDTAEEHPPTQPPV
jgi:hypothetical protein